jgi:hypothetical protein
MRMMKFFFPDSQDQVDPSFEFESETRDEFRIRQRDDRYAHEVFARPPFDGILVSKAIVMGSGQNSAKYSLPQRHRLLRLGVEEFFRLSKEQARPETMGDCGAFTYVKEEHPPFSVESVVEFYELCGFDYGISVDHVILAFRSEDYHVAPELESPPAEYVKRQEITLELAREFLTLSQRQSCCFTPVGVAQGWSPSSYASAVDRLQAMGYDYIALGGMVPLKTREILACLERIQQVRRRGTRFHLLGVTRCEQVDRFRDYGVVSFDSTSPFLQAFKDDRNNYHARGRTYTAVRVPQVEGNPKLLRRIRAGEIRQETALRLEGRCLRALAAFDRGGLSVEEALEPLIEYERLYDGKRDRSAAYREVLEDCPWKKCPCEICRTAGIHVVIFRGSERNKRRGFHNLWLFYDELRRSLGVIGQPLALADALSPTCPHCPR